VFTNELSADFDGAGAFCSGAEKDGEEFLVGKGSCSEGSHFLPRLLLVGEVMNAGVIVHLKEASIFQGEVASFSGGREDDCVF